jgi:hypothetical protein
VVFSDYETRLRLLRGIQPAAQVAPLQVENAL